MENGQLPDPANWAVADVVNYFKATGFEEQATAFQDQVDPPTRLHFDFKATNVGGNGNNIDSLLDRKSMASHCS